MVEEWKQERQRLKSEYFVSSQFVRLNEEMQALQNMRQWKLKQNLKDKESLK